MRELKLEKAFMLIEPGPLTLVTTFNGAKNNVMAISWTMVLNFGASPEFAICTGPWNWSFGALMESRECVLALPTAEMAKTAVEIGDCSGAGVDKFAKFGLTALPGKEVKAPLIKECFANIECRVTDYVKAHGIITLEGLRAWYDPRHRERRLIHAIGDGRFTLDGERLNLRRYMRDKLPPGV